MTDQKPSEWIIERGESLCAESGLIHAPCGEAHLYQAILDYLDAHPLTQPNEK